jgi:hypothetical protein
MDDITKNYHEILCEIVYEFVNRLTAAEIEMSVTPVDGEFEGNYDDTEIYLDGEGSRDFFRYRPYVLADDPRKCHCDYMTLIRKFIEKNKKMDQSEDS